MGISAHHCRAGLIDIDLLMGGLHRFGRDRRRDGSCGSAEMDVAVAGGAEAPAFGTVYGTVSSDGGTRLPGGVNTLWCKFDGKAASRVTADMKAATLADRAAPAGEDIWSAGGSVVDDDDRRHRIGRLAPGISAVPQPAVLVVGGDDDRVFA